MTRARAAVLVAAAIGAAVPADAQSSTCDLAAMATSVMNACCPGGGGLPPTALLAERRSVWYALRAGDAVLMDGCTWHRGGANTSGTRRTLLAASFVASDRDAAAARVPRLGDFLYF